MEVPVHNSGKHIMYVGGRAIPPGETRHIHHSLIPGHTGHSEEAAEAKPEEPKGIADLVTGKVSEIKEAVPNLSDEDLQALQEAEKAGAQRKGVFTAIEEERLKRAANPHEREAAEVQNMLPDLDDDELQQLLQDHADDDGVRSLVQDEIDRRAGDQSGE